MPPALDAPLLSATKNRMKLVDTQPVPRLRAAPSFPLIKPFSSIALGIVWLTLILIYASVASALPQVRGYVEMTEMEIFHHWIFLVLNVLFVINLMVATFTRIRWNWTNAGVLTTHLGLLLLVGGSVWYFWAKVEGDVRLDSPRVEIIDSRGEPVRSAMVLAAEGESWSTFMPVLGGRVSMLVQKAAGTPVSTVELLYRVGEQEAKTVTLTADNRTGEPISDRFRVRLTPGKPKSTFYDRDLAALHFRRADQDLAEMKHVPLHGLPIHRERFVSGPAMPVMPNNAAAVSQRTTSISTLGLEHWKMPLPVVSADLPVDVTVTGYLPYVRGMRQTVVPAAGGEAENPAVTVELTDGRGGQREQTLVALKPTESRLDTLVPVEFRYFKREDELNEWLAPLAGPHELTIEIKDPPTFRQLAVTKGEKITLEGTPYVLSVESLQTDWPLISPGYEGARSPAATVSISNGETHFMRTVIERFPEMTQDVDEQGMRRRTGLVDPNIVVRYRSVATMKLLIGATAEVEPVLAIVDSRGQVERGPLAPNQRRELPFGGGLTLKAFHRHSRVELIPVVEPTMFRRPNMDRRQSVIRLEFSGRGEHSGWKETRWTFFSDYPEDMTQPLRIRPPGAEQDWLFVYSRAERDLGVTLHPGKLTVTFFPGRQSAERWRSDFYVKAGDSAPQHASVYTNHTTTAGAWTLFQSGAANDHRTGDFWSFTILGVGNRHGIWPMLLGCVLIPLGSMYAFYVKPILIRRRKEQALAQARAAGRLAAES